LNEVQSDFGVVQAKSNNRFTTTINASVGFNQTASAFGQSYQSPLGKQSLTVGVNMPVFQWGAGGAEVAAARAEAERTQANNKQSRELLMENARFAALQLQQAQRAIIVNAKADTVAEKQFDVARNRYIIGKISNTDLYQAQNDKDGAVLSYVQSLQTYWTAFYQLRRITLYDFEKKQALVDR
jgi:outer membrane protein TolC